MMANPELFDAYFRHADTNNDGRISGQEAVSFFLGANLPKPTLAKIWQWADQGQTGFLSRTEFYNALKLVTIAQTGRELTPDIVKAALVGPASSQIPPPRITAPAQTAGGGGAAPPSSYRPPSSGLQQPSQGIGGGAAMGLPPRPNPNPGLPAARPTMVNPNLTPTPTPTPAPAPVPSSNPAAEWLKSQQAAASANSNSAQAPPAPRDAFSSFGQLESGPKASKPIAGADLFGGDSFQATPVMKPTGMGGGGATPMQPRAGGGALVPALGSLEMNSSSDFGNRALVPQPQLNNNNNKQPTSMAPRPALDPRIQQGYAGAPSGMGAPGQWPKMVQTDLQRYMAIFSKVDSDRDGKITGEQARALFLSWKLPIDALKKIWDLSDQDRDSMLSIQEFCISLYLMERLREGRTLPAVINPVMIFDESAISAIRIAEAQAAISQHSAGMNVPSWQQSPGHAMGNAPVRPGLPPTAPGRMAVNNMMYPTDARNMQPKSRTQALDPNFLNQPSMDREAEEAEKKAQEQQRQIMDSKEKTQYYQTKLQDIVLFKKRCDNRLAEITERAAADKREVESLAKRYDEKFKQAGESNARFLSEEAILRDLQERRLELQNAVVKIEQGGDINALLQSRADRIQSDLDELRKALNERCKRVGLKIKPTSRFELPNGWQPEIQGRAIEWDENWDQFEDEGFVVVHDLLDEATAENPASTNNTAAASWDEGSLFVDDEFDFSSIDAQNKSKGEDSGARSTKGDSEEEESVRSGAVSPSHDSSVSSPRHDKNVWESKANQSHDSGADIFSESNAWESAFQMKNEDELDAHPSWDSNTKLSSTAASLDGSPPHSKFNQSSSSSSMAFGFGDSTFDMPSYSSGRQDHEFHSFGLDPIRTKGKPSAVFDNSVPSTPLFTGGSLDSHHNPARDTFSRFDSFSSARDSPKKFSHQRFDSFSSVADTSHLGGGAGFISFDDGDSFSGAFDSYGQTPKHPGDDVDPFADNTGPFGGGESRGQTTKHSSDTWGAFS